MATLLDPRFKVKGFSSASFAKAKVLEKAKEIVNSSRGNPGDRESEENGRRKKKRKEFSLWEEFDKDDSDQPILSGEEREPEQYLSLPRLAHADDHLKFWKVHETHFPNLTPLAKVMLGIPPTSAESERVFSCAGNIVVPTRTCLDPQKVRMVVVKTTHIFKLNFLKYWYMCDCVLSYHGICSLCCNLLLVNLNDILCWRITCHWLTIG